SVVVAITEMPMKIQLSTAYRPMRPCARRSANGTMVAPTQRDACSAPRSRKLRGIGTDEGKRLATTSQPTTTTRFGTTSRSFQAEATKVLLDSGSAVMRKYQRVMAPSSPKLKRVVSNEAITQAI